MFASSLLFDSKPFLTCATVANSPTCLTFTAGRSARNSAATLEISYLVQLRKISTGRFLYFFKVRFSTQLLLPPLRFLCVGGCWDRDAENLPPSGMFGLVWFGLIFYVNDYEVLNHIMQNLFLQLPISIDNSCIRYVHANGTLV